MEIVTCCITGGLLWVWLGPLVDYWNNRDYYRVVKRNKKNLKKRS